MIQRRFLLILLLLPFLSSFGSTDQLTGSDPLLKQRQAMIQNQIVSRGIEDKRVLDALEKVPRHLFVPIEYRRQAYNDHAVPIGYGQTISQPFIVALMTFLLEVTPEDKVLEIGTGSGYQAAVLSHLTDEVYSVEIIEALAREAEERMEDLGYDTIELRESDGYYGWPEKGPFDKIIVTAAAGHVPPPLIEQLNPGGKIIIPLGNPFSTQILSIINKSEEGELTSLQVLPVRFVPFTGRVEE